VTWNLACPDWKERLQAGLPLVPDLPLFDEQANRAEAVFNKLRLADVTGTPTMGEAGGLWFRLIIRALFGSLDPVTKHRMIRELFLLVPKKNSKTTNGALLMLTALLLNRRPNASMIMTAPVQDVATLAFDAAHGAIELDPVLTKKLHVREHLKKIVHRETKAELEIMSFDPSALTGQKPVAVLIDELHVVAKMSKAASAIRQLRGGMLPFPEAFMAFITTQSEEAPVGVFKAELMKARAIRDGRQRGRMLPVLYEFPEETQTSDEWRDPKIWHRVNPNLGRSVTLDRLEADWAQAQEKGEEEVRRWASQHLNIEVGVGMRTDMWPGAEFWARGSDPSLAEIDDFFARCEVVIVGIDGGGLDDLFAICVAGRERDTDRWLYWFKAWAWPDVLKRRKSEQTKFKEFIAAGDLVLCGKNAAAQLEALNDDEAEAEAEPEPDADTPPTLEQDIAEITEICRQVKETGLLPEKAAIGLDPQGVGVLVDALAGIELVAPQVVAVSQGFRLSSAVWSLERKLKFGGAVHSGAPMMDWCVGNAKTQQRGNAVLITKETAGKAKIDPLIAGFNATKLLEVNPVAAGGKSFWEAA